MPKIKIEGDTQLEVMMTLINLGLSAAYAREDALKKAREEGTDLHDAENSAAKHVVDPIDENRDRQRRPTLDETA